MLTAANELRARLLRAGVAGENCFIRLQEGKVRHFYGQQTQAQKSLVVYTLEVLILNYSNAPEILFQVLTAWLDENQPDHAADKISFTIEPINNQQCDAKFLIKDVQQRLLMIDTASGTHINACPAHPNLANVPFQP